jgi:hypothetical protein
MDGHIGAPPQPESVEQRRVRRDPQRMAAIVDARHRVRKIMARAIHETGLQAEQIVQARMCGNYFVQVARMAETVHRLAHPHQLRPLVVQPRPVNHLILQDDELRDQHRRRI